MINAAAKVGGIWSNMHSPFDFLMDNMLIQNNLIAASIRNSVNKFIFLGSSCIYPRDAEQPMTEDVLLSGSLEPTNQYYAIAKISGLKACEAANKQYNQDFLSLMPTNLYGPGDNFSEISSHVIPAMIRKFHLAKENNSSRLELWGTGEPKREFLHVHDLANAVLFCLENELKQQLLNVGSGREISIADLAELIKEIVGYQGDIIWDENKPDGTGRKLLDSSILNNAGWKSQIDLKEGLERTYQWFLSNIEDLREVDLNSNQYEGS